MNSIKDLINKIDKQKLTLLLSIIGVMLIIIVAIAIAVKVVGSSITYEELEEKLEIAAEKYMAENPDNLPSEKNPVSVISATTLIQEKYIKELKKYVKDASCTANVNVYWNEGKYRYQAFLTCNTYKTQTFLDVIKNSNELSSYGEGLYELNGEFVYRGQNPNNYVKFAKKTWRIVKITNKNEFLLIRSNFTDEEYGVWDDRYNTDATASKGINTYALSRIKYNLEKLYKKDLNDYTELLTTFNICIGKRINATTDKSGFTECSETINDQMIGLLPVYDYLNASLDNACTKTTSEECQNYNYLVNDNGSWWTITGSGKSTYHAYLVEPTGAVAKDTTDSSAYYRYTITLNKNTLYKSGTGTEKDPYIIR